MTDLSAVDLSTHDLSQYHVITLNFANQNTDYKKILDYLDAGGNVFIAFNYWAYGANPEKAIEKLLLEECCKITIMKDWNCYFFWDGGVTAVQTAT